MALSKKITMDISSSITDMNKNDSSKKKTAAKTTAKKVAVQTFEEEEEESVIPPAEYEQPVKKTAAKKSSKASDGSVLVGFKLPPAAKEQYREFFEGYGLNLSEAVKNALEYFVADIQKGKVKITLTRHFERVEEE